MTTTPINTMAPQATALADLDLLDRYRRQQDQEAFAELVRRYGDMVYATCYRVLGQRELAQEAAQETFYRLLLHSIKINRSLAGWLHQVAVKLSLDIRRSNLTRQQREHHYSVIRDNDDAQTSWRELSTQVDEALNRLPGSTRQLLIRHYLLGVKQEELAREMQLSPATIHRRIQAGLHWLRESLKANGVKISLVTLGVLLTQQTTQAAPPAFLIEVGKMNLAHAALPHPACPQPRLAKPLIQWTCPRFSTLLVTLFILLTALLAIILFVVLAFQSQADPLAHLSAIPPAPAFLQFRADS